MAAQAEPKKPPPLEDELTKSEQIKEGANDLMHLPLEVLQEELIKRRYYPKMVRKFSKNYCVALLREEINPTIHNTLKNKKAYVTKRGLKIKQKNSTPTFSAIAKNADGNDNKEEEEIDEIKSLPDIHPSAFKPKGRQ